ncbi:MAG: PIN domain-containing protein [Thermoplasmatota archaeon]
MAFTAAVVVLDTNALLLPFTDGTDLHGELERLLGAPRWVVAAPSVTELATLAAGDGATARAAKAAQRLAASCAVEATELPGDDGVLDVAGRLGAAVVTNDRKLQGEAQRRGLAVVASRGKGRLFLKAPGAT